MILPLIILAVVFLLIMIRQVGRVRLQIWQIMLGGAIAVLITGQIAPITALQSINIDVMIFLFCMFLLGQALEESGYLQHLAFKMFQRAKSTDMLVLSILFGIGMLSALLMNDTLAIIGTPVVLLMAQRHKMSSKLLLLALCFAVTIGGLMSPIGSPHNLLIAFEMERPFTIFFTNLFIPTVLSLLAVYAVLRIMYRHEFHKEPLIHVPEAVKDARLAFLAKTSLILLVLFIIARLIIVAMGFNFKITYIAIAAILPLLFHREWSIVKRIDWSTLIFFAAMFILMASVWETGFFQNIAPDMTPGSIILFSILVSQLISNVPLVALTLPLISGTSEYLALAVGSSLAGALTILGAASNIIVIQNAEKREITLSFWEFAKAGVPITAITAFIYWLFL